MDQKSQKHLALAEVLYQKAKQAPGGMSASATNHIEQARNGRYARGGIRPAFLFENFGMTDQEWSALIALIYG